MTSLVDARGRSSRGLWWSTGVLALALALPTPRPAVAQTLAPSFSGHTGGLVGRVHVEARPGSPMAAITLALPVGSARDPEGAEGTARALAGVVVRQVEASLGRGSVVVSLDVLPYRTTLDLLVTPDAWRSAVDALLGTAFGGSLDPGLAAAELGGLREMLEFEAGAPILDVRRETRRLLYGPTDPGTRPPDGTPATLATVDRAGLEAFQRAHYRSDEAVLVVVGVADAEATLRALEVESAAAPDSVSAPPPATDSAAPVPAVEPMRAPPPLTWTFTGPTPWQTGDRLRITQDVTSTWITVAYPVPADLPSTLLEFVAHRLHEELNPSPPDPGLFSVRVDVVNVPQGRTLVLEAAVLPDAADRWEARLLAAVEALRQPAEASFFRWQRRRFRAAMLLREATPEEAASRQATDLLNTGSVRDLAEAVWVLNEAALAAGAAALGPPRIMVYGPDLAGGEP